MSDLVVTCPKNLWAGWLAEGDCAGEPYNGEEWAWYGSGKRPRISAGERLYVVAHGRLRGYAPVVGVDRGALGQWAILRRGDAVACTIAEPIKGFQSWRYVWWHRADELPFPDWRTP